MYWHQINMYVTKTGIYRLFFLFMMLFFMLIGGCKYPDVTNYASLYRIRNAGSPGISLRLFHANDTLSFLHYRVNSGNLSQIQFGSRNDTARFIRVEFILYADQLIPPAIDSIQVNCDFNRDSVVTGYFPLKNLENGEYEIRIRQLNLKGEYTATDHYRFSKKSIPCPDDFLLLDGSGQIIFERHVSEGVDFYVVAGSAHQIEGRFILLKPSKQFPDPPFIHSPDSPTTFEIINLPEEGSKDTTFVNTGRDQLLCFMPDHEKYCIPVTFIREKGFPYETSIAGKLGAMRYLLTDSEYAFLTQPGSDEKNIHEFWLMAGGNAARAMTLMHQYFERISSANQWFTTFKNGWSTDRGMIYCVLGTPGRVYRSKAVETWVYIGIDHGSDITFNFRNQEIFPGLFEWVLERDSRYSNFWMEKVTLLRR